MLRIKNLTKKIDGRTILDHTDITMTTTHLRIKGESGSGKSTLARIIAGLDQDYSGEVWWNNQRCRDFASKDWMKCVQYVPQYERDTLDNQKTVEAVLKAPLKNFKFDRATYSQKIDDVLKQCLLPQSMLQQRVQTLSGGQFQRLWIAKALIVEPEVLILDEATTNLDVMNEDLMLDMLQNIEGLQMIVISHDPYVLSCFEGAEYELKMNATRGQ
ncbi:ATP-binding cassette domain-containing protein [Staphylococcus coagulans]|uniref:ATP-binding cassette domain-containing protein n=1 Tax=Staphylococcus coagulans TaxID=74706 RepID=UPI001BEA7A87|nr:ATP-binding cassette domain-containing protein [Staphylococcus coagulans]MBT2814992.1 ATP-binding cassette domain-containing protein [Staphylococcus coagulans]MBT2817261.1 ATP-binding cassette domain-containing protein [Staphylococcus coagulans]MBT2837900.1 ATP-binding cassette domain-containing protein [Staphylococcus coagulans]MBT2842401.1 ATP-binding cassette domain-containing protein [Staphylococcus coagulans]MBT2849207.1 ATP-binding cassette domain-containing protein [Staphylococcus co